MVGERKGQKELWRTDRYDPFAVGGRIGSRIQTKLTYKIDQDVLL
jgi:hypothetical protein